MGVKINVSISEETLKKLDGAVREAKTSRSAFLAKAVEHFLEEKEQEKLWEQRKKAAERIDEIAKIIGPWDATAEVLKWRDRH